MLAGNLPAIDRDRRKSLCLIMKILNFKKKSTIIIIIIIVFLIAAHYLGLSKYTNKYIRFAINPIIRSANFSASSIGDFLAPYLSRSDLNKKNEQLSQKIIELSRENIELQFLRQENEFLRKEIKFLDNFNYRYIIAYILGSGPDYTSTDILINKGWDQGLYEGLPVTTAQGVIIGKISQVEDNISHLKLLTDNQTKISIIVASRHSSLGLAYGLHNINIKIDMLPKDARIEPGDLVSTSGLDQYIPAGLLVGQISKIEDSQEKLWQTGIVEPAIDYRQVRRVTVILPD